MVPERSDDVSSARLQAEPHARSDHLGSVGKVVLADDSASVRRLVVTRLQADGYEMLRPRTERKHLELILSENEDDRARNPPCAPSSSSIRSCRHTCAAASLTNPDGHGQNWSSLLGQAIHAVSPRLAGTYLA